MIVVQVYASRWMKQPRPGPSRPSLQVRGQEMPTLVYYTVHWATCQRLFLHVYVYVFYCDRGSRHYVPRHSHHQIHSPTKIPQMIEVSRKYNSLK